MEDKITRLRGKEKFKILLASKQTPERNRTHYSTDEEFDLNEVFVEPCSIILKTPMKRKRL